MKDKDKSDLKRLRKYERDKKAVVDNSVAKLDTYATLVNQEMNTIVEDPEKRKKIRKELIKMFNQQIKELKKKMEEEE